VTDQIIHPFREYIPAYALGALDPEEIEAVEEHLKTCQECQVALAEYQAVANGLLFAMPPQAPPDRLRKELSDRLAARKEPARPNIKPARSFGWYAIGFVIIALAVLNLIQASQVRELRQQRADLAKNLQDSQAAMALIVQPGAKVLPIAGQGSEGNLLIGNQTNTAVLFVNGLPLLDPSHTYQVWLIPSNGSPVSVGFFEAGAQQPYIWFIVTSTTPIQQFSALGVTVEPKGGSQAPTAKPILTVGL
jgi:anti-sigma-K factor RskA